MKKINLKFIFSFMIAIVFVIGCETTSPKASSLNTPSISENVQTYTVSLKPGEYSQCEIYGPYTGLMVSSSVRIGQRDDSTQFYNNSHNNASFLWFTRGWMTWEYPVNIPSHSEILSLSYIFEIASECPGSNRNWPSDVTVNINSIDIGTWTIPGDPGSPPALQPNKLPLGDSQYGWLTTWTLEKTGTYFEYKFRDGNMSKRKLSDVTINDLNILPNKNIRITLSVPKEPFGNKSGGINIFGNTWGDYSIDPTITIKYRRKSND